MTGDQAPGVSAAERELDNVQELTAAHNRRCHNPGCTTCRSLARHLARCQEQIVLLARAADQGALF